MAKGVQIDLIVDPKGAIEGIGKASDSASSATSVFSSLGKIGATAVAALGAAALGAAAGLAAATRSAAKYADDILTAATNTNLSTDQLQAYKYAAEQMDVSFDTFTASQGKFTKSMQDSVQSGSGPAAEAFKTLGLSVTDSKGNMVDSTKLYWDAVDALGKVSNETERTALAQQIFGKSGAEMNSIIAKGSAGFAELTAEAQKNGAVMSGEQIQALGAFDDKMQALTSTVSGAKNALGLTLLPVLDDLAGTGTNAIGQFSSALLDANGDISKAMPAFETLAKNIGDGLVKALPKILQIGTSIVSGLLQGIIAQAPTLITAAVPILVNFVAGLVAMLPMLLTAAMQVLTALMQGLTVSIPILIPAAVAAILGLVDALIANLPLLIDAGIQLIVALALGLINALPQLVAKIPDLITGVISALVAAIPQLVAAGVQLFIALIQNMPAIIAGIIKAVPQIVTAIVGMFGKPEFWQQMGEAGLQLIKGLWEGIKNAGDWLWRQIQRFFKGVIDNIKNLFGIHSPSTVFAGMGQNMIGGLEQGLTGRNNLSAIMGDLSDQVTGGFSGSLTATARGVLSQAGVVSGGIVVNVQGGLDSGPEIGRRVAEALRNYSAAGGRVAF